jgi:hypothetical protein
MLLVIESNSVMSALLVGVFVVLVVHSVIVEPEAVLTLVVAEVELVLMVSVVSVLK